MAKLRVFPNGVTEFEGTDQELLAIYDGLLKKRQTDQIQIVDQVPHKFDPPPPTHRQFALEVQELRKSMPTIDQLITYLLSKPKFEHDILDVETHFFTKQINSRKYGRLYRELRTKLENARKSIEVSQHGAFERRSARPRNLQVYSFRPVNATLLGIQPEKTS